MIAEQEFYRTEELLNEQTFDVIRSFIRFNLKFGVKLCALGGYSDADDLFQLTCLRLMKARHRRRLQVYWILRWQTIQAAMRMAQINKRHGDLNRKLEVSSKRDVDANALDPADIDDEWIELKNQLIPQIDRLWEKDRAVIRMRYGLDNENPDSFRDIANTLGLSPQRIQQIERRAIARLRKNMIIEGLISQDRIDESPIGKSHGSFQGGATARRSNAAPVAYLPENFDRTTTT